MIPYLESNGRDRQAAVPSGQSSTVARNVTRDGRLGGPPAVASWRLFEQLVVLGQGVWSHFCLRGG